MQFQKDNIYHIYNQGNNRQQIFFNRDNYLFFLRKINNYILPYGDILAWCLMPNHFHLMVFVKETSLDVLPRHGGFLKPTVSKDKLQNPRTINAQIGIMLMSYTKAFNKQNNRTGKLFREETKAECINCTNGITPSFITKEGITKIKISDPEKEYPQVCFNYIHNNPVKAKLVKKTTDWEYSSAKDYANLRNGELINKFVAKQYVNF